MVDLHCHILPNMDDGAKSIDESIEILKMQEEQNFERIVATPHFYIQKESLDVFLKRRINCLDKLCKDSKILDIKLFFKLGAEVFYSEDLINLDLKKLCIEKTNYLLLELPTGYVPSSFGEFIYELQIKGITPIIAHVERYIYAMRNMDIVYDWVSNGCLIQVNAASIVNSKVMRKNIIKLINSNLVHVIATDAHNTDRRKPLMDEAMKILNKKVSIAKMAELKRNSIDIFDGKNIDVGDIKKPKKSIFAK